MTLGKQYKQIQCANDLYFYKNKTTFIKTYINKTYENNNKTGGFFFYKTNNFKQRMCY